MMNIIIATIFGVVALIAAWRIFFVKRSTPTSEAEMKLRKVQSQRRWFIFIFSASITLITGLLWGYAASGFAGWGWLAAIALFTVAAVVYAQDKIRAASAIAVASAALLLVVPTLPSLFAYNPAPSMETRAVIEPQLSEDGATPALVTGAATITDENPATVLCGIQEDGSSIPLNSWTDLVNCINDAPESERATYIAAANDRANLGLSWDDILAYAEREKAEGIDSRSILALNVGDLSEPEIRAAAVEAAGEAAATLPIIHQDGYLNNSSSFHDGSIQNVADGRAQVRVQLNPIEAPYEQTVAAPRGVKLSSYEVNYKAGGSVLVECANFTGGTTPEPPKPPKPPVPPVTPPPTVPPTTPPTTPPCTPGPEKCAEDDRLNEDPVNPAPAPSGAPETEEPAEESPAGPPSEDPQGSETDPLPSDGVEPGSGEGPREEVPDVPADVPTNENNAPNQGDQDPDTQPAAPVLPALPAPVDPPAQQQTAPEEVVEAPAPAPAPEAPAAPVTPPEEAPATPETDSGLIGEAEDVPPAASLGMLLPFGVAALGKRLKGRRLSE